MKQIIKIFLFILVVASIGCVPHSLNNAKRLDIQPALSLYSPQWSPDGKQIIASTQSYSKNESAIYLIDVQSRKARNLIDSFGILTARGWSPDSSKIIFSANGSDEFQNGIWFFNIIDNSSYFMGDGDTAALSPDGTRLATFLCKPKIWEAEIVLHDFAEGTTTKIYGQEKCSKDAIISWSSDGENLTFSYSTDILNEEKTDNVYILNILSGNLVSMPGAGNWAPSWSPDGKNIVFITTKGVAIADANGVCIKEISDSETLSSLNAIHWSADGKNWLIARLGQLYIVDIESTLGQEFRLSESPCP